MCSGDADQILLDHSEFPRNVAELPEAGPFFQIDNPGCGDVISCRAEMADGKVRAIQIQCDGCAVSTASASIMGETVKDLNPGQVKDLVEKITSYLDGSTNSMGIEGEVKVLGSLKKFPMRHKCVSMSWELILRIVEELSSAK